VLDIKSRAHHCLQLGKGVVCLDGLIGKPVDELNAVLLDLVAFLLGGRLKDGLVESVGGDGNIEGILLELLHRPGIVRCEEDAAEFLVLVRPGLNKLIGFIGGHSIEDVVESSVLVFLGHLDFLKEVLVVDGLNKLVKVNEKHIFVADQGFGQG